MEVVGGGLIEVLLLGTALAGMLEIGERAPLGAVGCMVNDSPLGLGCLLSVEVRRDSVGALLL